MIRSCENAEEDCVDRAHVPDGRMRGHVRVGEHVSAPACAFARVSNALSLSVRTAQKKYYEHWRVCDDASCALRTQATRVGAPERCPARGCRGKLVDEYGAKALYVQLKYLESLFDWCPAR